MIEKFRQLLKDPNIENPDQIRNRLLELLDEVNFIIIIITITTIIILIHRIKSAASFSLFVFSTWDVLEQNIARTHIFFLHLDLVYLYYFFAQCWGLNPGPHEC